MDYREVEPPDELRPLVKLGWSLSVPAGGAPWFSHVATPDGCLEIIRRLSGRSRWRDEQPESFVAGAITRPAELQLGAGSSFVALRIWPWAWRLISGRSPAELVDRWDALAAAAPDFALPDTIDACFAAMAAYAPSAAMREMVAALADARTPGELARRTGRSPKALQRWFQYYVGQPPRSYLRMVRFGDAFAELPRADAGLAGHAADHGFADQAHMSREFRALAGTPALQAKVRSVGPFIEPPE